MSVNKKIKQKHRKDVFKNTIHKVLRVIFYPMEKIVNVIKRIKKHRIRKLEKQGQEMNIDKAVDIAASFIIDYIVKYECGVELLVCEYADWDYGYYDTTKWLLNKTKIKYDNRNSILLRSFLNKMTKENKNKLTCTKILTEALYQKLQNVEELDVKWIEDKETYGYWRSSQYERTLIIKLKK